MGRWEPDARGRLLRAALDLFADQGYEATTAAQIAERAGLTKTTLFRLFADKREVLFQGQSQFVATAAAGVAAAPDGASPSTLLRAGVFALCDAHVPEQQEIGRRIEQLVAASAELQERAVFKRAAITTALEAALVRRRVDRRLAGVLAEIGIRAYYEGFSLWSHVRQAERLSAVVADELAAYEAVTNRIVPLEGVGPELSAAFENR